MFSKKQEPEAPLVEEAVPDEPTYMVRSAARHAGNAINLTFPQDPVADKARSLARAALAAINDEGDGLGEVVITVTLGDRAIAATACYTDAQADDAA
jgi:hypothetical protein